MSFGFFSRILKILHIHILCFLWTIHWNPVDTAFGEPCRNVLGMRYGMSPLSDLQFSLAVSSGIADHVRLFSPEAWEPDTSLRNWIQINTSSSVLLTGVQVQGNVKSSGWVTGWTLETSLDCEAYDSQEYYFEMENPQHTIEVTLRTPVFVSCLQIIPTHYFGTLPALRLELLGCVLSEPSTCSPVVNAYLEAGLTGGGQQLAYPREVILAWLEVTLNLESSTLMGDVHLYVSRDCESWNFLETPFVNSVSNGISMDKQTQWLTLELETPVRVRCVRIFPPWKARIEEVFTNTCGSQLQSSLGKPNAQQSNHLQEDMMHDSTNHNSKDLSLYQDDAPNVGKKQLSDNDHNEDRQSTFLNRLIEATKGPRKPHDIHLDPPSATLDTSIKTDEDTSTTASVLNDDKSGGFTTSIKISETSLPSLGEPVKISEKHLSVDLIDTSAEISITEAETRSSTESSASATFPSTNGLTEPKIDTQKLPSYIESEILSELEDVEEDETVVPNETKDDYYHSLFNELFLGNSDFDDYFWESNITREESLNFTSYEDNNASSLYFEELLIDEDHNLRSAGHDSRNFTLSNNISASECGVRNASQQGNRRKRVVSGYQNLPGEWPWLVTFHYLVPTNFTNNSGFNHLCGGSLIDDEWVLSAAHCFSNDVLEGLFDTALWEAYFGVHDLANLEGKQKREIVEIIIHPGFDIENEKPLLNDIALVKLSSPVNLTDTVSILCLDDWGSFHEDQECFVSGWGQISTTSVGSQFANTVATSLLSNRICADMYDQTPEDHEIRKWVFIEPQVMCANIGPDGQDACQGDSGGPLMCEDQGQWYQVGVVSSGFECGLPKFPGIYTRVSYFANWIRQTMQLYTGN